MWVRLTATFAAVRLMAMPQGVPAPASAGNGAVQVFGAAVADDVVGPGDLLDVRVFGQPQLDGSLRVSPDGKVSPAFIDAIEVGGSTPTEIEHTLTTAYGRMLIHPLVSVRVVEINSREVFVNGAVPHPGAYAYSGQLHLMQALSEAGGIDPAKASPRVLLLHQPPPITHTNGQGKTTVSIDSVLETIDTSQLGTHPELNRLLHSGDIVEVEEAKRVFVTGDVLHPGEVVYRPGMTATQAVSISGGLLPQADHEHIRVLRLRANDSGRDEISVDVGGVERNRAADVTLAENDILVAGGSSMRMVGLELLDFFTGTERWHVQQTVANAIP